MAADPALPPDLVWLAGEYPDWQFGKGWTSAGTGPDVRCCWAKRGTQELRAGSAGALTALVALAARDEGR